MVLKQKLLEYALRILAKKRYTGREIHRKLEQYLKRRELGVGDDTGSDDTGSTAAIDQVIARLIELKYIDDRQYARDFIADRAKFRPRGKFLLKKELKARGIDEQACDEIIKEMSFNEMDLASSALDKKERTWTREGSSVSARTKAIRFLAARGFSPDTIYKTVNERYNRAKE